MGGRTSAIANLVERQARYCQLVALPDGSGAVACVRSVSALVEGRSSIWRTLWGFGCRASTMVSPASPFQSLNEARPRVFEPLTFGFVCGGATGQQSPFPPGVPCTGSLLERT
jgi:hypothetical protein